MKLEILMATINQSDYSLLDRINLNSDIFVCNQNMNKFNQISFMHNNNQVTWFDFMEKGVGLNRNNALMRSTADICLLSDDDVYYDDDYKETILSAFESNPKADMILLTIGTR